MMVDGRAIAKELGQKVKESLGSTLPELHIILVGDDVPSRQFVNIKQKFGAGAGVKVVVHEYEAEASVEDLTALLNRLAVEEKVKGIIIQLPLPPHLPAEELIKLIPASKDVDALSEEARVLPPVAAAVAEILKRGQVKLIGLRAVVLGKGKLVGAPVAVWLAGEGAEVMVIDSKTANSKDLIKNADLIVSGIGKPGFIKPEMIKEGVILIDAGTSALPVPGRPRESSGQVVGDADPACASKCALFTPVPGGVGPITVAKIFENLLKLTS